MLVKTVVAFTATIFSGMALAAPSVTEVGFSAADENAVLKKRWGGNYAQFFPMVTTEFTPWKYVGCYSNDIRFTYNTNMCSCKNNGWKGTYTDMPFLMNKCFANCKAAGYRYAAIKGGNGNKSCFCGNNVSDDNKLSTESKCNIPCASTEGDKAKGYDYNKCGGDTTWSVYKDPCLPDFDPEVAVNNYNYVGCYYYYGEGSLLTEYQEVVAGDNLSIDGCVEACSALGFAFAGTSTTGSQYIGTQCWCGGKVTQQWKTRHQTHLADNNQCTMLCSATAKVKKSISKEDYQYCGNWWYMSLYYNADLDYSDNCPIGGEKQTTVTTFTAGPTAGTTTIFPTSNGKPVTNSGTATVRITSTVQTQKTITTTTKGPKAGTTTLFPTDDNGDDVTNSGTATVRITTVAQTQKTITTTTKGPKAGTTTIYPTDDNGDDVTNSGTATVRITSVVQTQKTTTRTTKGPKPGTTTIFPTSNGKPVTNSGTATVVITTCSQVTVTTTTTGPEEGTTTIFPTGDDDQPITNEGTATVVITALEATQAYVTTTTPGPKAGTTTLYPTDDNGDDITNSGTATVVITSVVKNSQKTTTRTTGGPKVGTTTVFPSSNGKPVTNSGTATVIITTTTKKGYAKETQVYTTTTTTGPEEGTATLFPTDDNGDPITNSGTATVVVTSVVSDNPGPSDPAGEQDFTTTTTTGDAPGTTTLYPTDDNGDDVTDSGTATVVVTVTASKPVITGNPKTICTIPKPAAKDLRQWKGISFPLGGKSAPAVNCHDNMEKYKAGFHFKIYPNDAGIKCRLDYTHTVTDIQNACWNACVEQHKMCKTTYAAKKVCNNGTCWEKSVLITQCQTQFDACKSANAASTEVIQKANSSMCKNWKKPSYRL
ncbi:hypothetical protein H072_973 [Dactylellina haptotyla CBS 200.50]|uniref:WSC domain-containing protein n=1 Tax=Dactylellina haptotyla (strain CBS 200.50) TaxID=1284197 RepID=S8APZ1_DACHA|nr:hypothetical protein H072_973 [Dactylellina haptotyla CBS 200.50]